jgi:hypothetical protein
MHAMSTSGEPNASRAGPARRRPGTGFPVVPLPEAARIIREAGKYGFEHSVSSFARYMGHSSTNSGAFRQRLAAFRDWKLIAGRGDTVVFTDTAKTIALPPSEAAERDALQTAFMNCTVFRQLLESAAKGQPLKSEHFGARAVLDLGVSPSAIERFVASFIESAAAAGLIEVDNDHVVILETTESVQLADAGEDDESVKVRQERSVGAVRRTDASPVVHQEWMIPAGAVIFEVRLERPLPAGIFVQLGVVVQELENLAEQLGQVAANVTHDGS